MALTEFDPIQAVKGVGEVSAAAFQKIGVERVGDLLMHLPLRYDFFDAPAPLDPEKTGVLQAVEARLLTAPKLAGTRRLPVLSVRATDGTTDFNLTWFRMPYLKQKLKKGEAYIFRGRLVRNRYGLTMEQASSVIVLSGLRHEEKLSREFLPADVFRIVGEMRADA